MMRLGILAAMLLGAVACAQTAAEWIAEGEKLGRDQTKAAQTRARELFERGLTAAAAAGDRELEARALYRLGVNAIYLNESRRAIEFFERAIPLQRALGLRSEETRSLNNKASALWQLGEVVEALDVYNALLPIRRELKDRLGESLTEAGIGNCFLTMGESAASLEHYRMALVIARELKDRNQMAEMQNSLGNALVYAGDFAGALASFEGAAALWRQAKNPLRLLYVENNLGWVNVGLRQYGAAVNYLRNIERDLQPTGDRRALSYGLHNLGSAHAGSGQAALARANFERSLAIKREIGDRAGEAYTLQALGEILPDEAERYWQQALEIRREIPDAQGLIVTLGALARLHRDQQKLPLARMEMEEAIELIESRRAALVSQDLRATYFSRKRDYYDFLVDLMMSQHDYAAALTMAERARGRQLADRVSDTLAGVRQGVDAKLLDRERALQRRIALAVGRAPKAQVEALLRQARDVAEEIRRASPRYASLVAPAPLTAAEMQGLLAPGEAMLVYLAAEPRSTVWTVTAAEIRPARLPGRSVMAAQLRLLRQVVTQKQGYTAELARLRSTLIPALPPGLKVQRLIVAADGVLESAPFSLLWPGEVAMLPSASALALRRRERPATGTRVDILADPVFSPRDERLSENSAPMPPNIQPRLRFSRIEAEGIAAMARQKRLGLDAEANREFLLGAREAGTLHLATHALIDSTYPELSALVLSQYDAQGRAVDGLMRLGEILNLSLKARLVTLSACRSAQGTDLPGEGLMSLTRGFLYAGAGAVVASLWDVDDRATAELMRRFYRGYLVQKLAPAAALRAAQQSVRKEPGWEHPYYWAAFTVAGEWR